MLAFAARRRSYVGPWWLGMDDDGPNPYAAPVHTEPLELARVAPGYRPAATMTLLLSACLALYGLSALVGVAFAFMELELLAAWPDMDPAALDANDARLNALGT